MATTVAPHIVILPSPGMGHLIPLTEFARSLLRRHRISATILIPSADGHLSDSQKTLLSTLDYLLLPAANLDDAAADAAIETRISLTVSRSLPSIRAAVKTLIDGGRNISAFFVDVFGTDGFEIAREFKIPPYIFFPSTAMVLSLFLHLPELDEMVSCEYRDLAGKLQIPGCTPVHGKDLLDPVQDRSNEAYKWTLHHAKRYIMAEGIIVNSFKELEPGPIEALLQKENGKPIVYPIGPLIHSDEDLESCTCSKWLNEQPENSVLYVSFGSGGTLSHDQMIELALGLEMSEQRFLWVVRCPNDTISNAAFFGTQNSNDPLAYLPKGFLDRTRARGLVVKSWARQVWILAHRSISAFLTHCGWNSTLESVVNGVPLIAWPLYAEQKMNTVIVHEDVKVAVRVKEGENGLVGRAEIANVVKGLMVGEGKEEKEIRSRIRDLKDAAKKVLSEDGDSTKVLGELANKWGVQIRE